MHALMDDAKLRIIQSYEQGLAPAGSDKRGPTVLYMHIRCLNISIHFLYYVGIIF